MPHTFGDPDDANGISEEDIPAVADSSSTEGTPLLGEHTHEQKDSPIIQRHHAHGSMNMRALVLHVMGDALGNVGVIATGLIIWLTTWKFKYYFDPLISLIITIIIFSSALPLGVSNEHDKRGVY